MERRRFTRVPFGTTARVVAANWKVSGSIEDLSLQGLRLRACTEATPDEAVLVTIVLSEPLELSFEVPGSVVRCDERGLAVRFSLEGIDVGTLTHLRYIVGTELGDLDEVMGEYSRWLGDQDD